MTAWWQQLSKGRRVVYAVLAAIVILNVSITALGAVVDSAPAGAPSSPTATNGNGLEGYVDLLRSRGHSVRTRADDLARGDLPTGATVVLADPIRLSNEDASELRRFVNAGGRLVLVGADTAAIVEGLTGVPLTATTTESVSRLSVWVPTAVTGTATELAGDAGQRWDHVGDLLPIAGDRTRPTVVTTTVGPTQVIALAGSGPLRNRNLAKADNATFALALATSGRPVVFVDRTAPPSNSGFSAVPSGWKWTAAALALAALVFLWSAGTRFGPAEPGRRALRPARRDHVDAVAASLAGQRPDPATTVASLTEGAADAAPTDLDGALAVGQKAAEHARRIHRRSDPGAPT